MSFEMDILDHIDTYKFKQIVKLVSKCGGEYVRMFQANTTHVIMHTEAAEDIVRSLGGELGMDSPYITSLDDKGGLNTLSREWIFDSLSNFTLLDMDLYYRVQSNIDFHTLKNMQKKEVAKVSKLLFEMERLNLHQYKGKSLDATDFDLDEPLEFDNEMEDEEDTFPSNPITEEDTGKLDIDTVKPPRNTGTCPKTDYQKPLSVRQGRKE